MNLSEEDQLAYRAYLKRLRDIASEQHTKMTDVRLLTEELEKRLSEERKPSVLGVSKKRCFRCLGHFRGRVRSLPKVPPTPKAARFCCRYSSD